MLNDNATEYTTVKKSAFPREEYKIDIDGICKWNISTIHAAFFCSSAITLSLSPSSSRSQQLKRWNGRNDKMHHFNSIRIELILQTYSSCWLLHTVAPSATNSDSILVALRFLCMNDVKFGDKNASQFLSQRLIAAVRNAHSFYALNCLTSLLAYRFKSPIATNLQLLCKKKCLIFKRNAHFLFQKQQNQMNYDHFPVLSFHSLEVFMIFLLFFLFFYQE